jgi:peptidoglycan hydrolase-like protein with peptidoglycan-binding domain
VADEIFDLGPASVAEDLGDPVDDPDGDDENVKTTVDVEDPLLETPINEGASPAPACRAALNQATERFPLRNRASDGIMCDAAHPSSSDHCSGNAFDLTDDAGHSCDAHALVEQLKQRRDPRVKYIISKRRIWNPSISDAWRDYNGDNPHVKHAHVSILTAAREDTAPWWTGPVPDPNQSLCTLTHPLLKEGARGDAVLHLQDMLIRSAHDLSQEGGTNGVFSAGVTREVKAFQAHRGLRDDGKVGNKTWSKLHEVINQHI